MNLIKTETISLIRTLSLNNACKVTFNLSSLAASPCTRAALDNALDRGHSVRQAHFYVIRGQCVGIALAANQKPGKFGKPKFAGELVFLSRQLTSNRLSSPWYVSQFSFVSTLPNNSSRKRQHEARLTPFLPLFLKHHQLNYCYWISGFESWFSTPRRPLLGRIAN